jgi:hypothetical protein
MAELYRLEDHCCRACLGRVASRLADDGRSIVQCSNCGAQAVGEPAAICCCGIRRGKFGRLRCIRLDQPLPGVMAQVVVSEVDDGR